MITLLSLVVNSFFFFTYLYIYYFQLILINLLQKVKFILE